jgi:membrane associated rhomboid family serine protease
MNYHSPRHSTISPIWIILAVNVMVFLATLIDQETIYMRFGLIPFNFAHNPWTVFTYMFVHAGWGHIISNMITLYFFGTFAMSLVGEGFFLITYFVGGIMGGLLFYLVATLTGHSLSILVGASGAIYALGGLLLVMRPNARVIAFPIPIPMPLWIAILVGFLIVSFLPGVAWEAHLGGILFGAVVGYFFRRRERGHYRYN